MKSLWTLSIWTHWPLRDVAVFSNMNSCNKLDLKKASCQVMKKQQLFVVWKRLCKKVCFWGNKFLWSFKLVSWILRAATGTLSCRYKHRLYQGHGTIMANTVVCLKMIWKMFAVLYLRNLFGYQRQFLDHWWNVHTYYVLSILLTWCVWRMKICLVVYGEMYIYSFDFFVAVKCHYMLKHMKIYLVI